jgi:hypothetical protein
MKPFRNSKANEIGSGMWGVGNLGTQLGIRILGNGYWILNSDVYVESLIICDGHRVRVFVDSRSGDR